jgi:hypothetical protein
MGVDNDLFKDRSDTARLEWPLPAVVNHVCFDYGVGE